MDNNAAMLSSNMGAFDPAFTPFFGNTAFQVVPSQTGEVSNTFGTVPYVSIESLIKSGGAAQQDPTQILSGSSQGNSVIQGQTSIQDANGLTRMIMGYVPGGF